MDPAGIALTIASLESESGWPGNTPGNSGCASQTEWPLLISASVEMRISVRTLGANLQANVIRSDVMLCAAPSWGAAFFVSVAPEGSR